MATNQPTGPTPQELALIEKYWKAIGASIDTVNRRMAEVQKDSAAFASDLETAERHFGDILFSTRDLAKTFSGVLEDIKGVNTTANKGVTAFKALNSVAEDLARHQDDINRLSIKDLENLQKKYKKNKDILFGSIEEIRVKKEQTALEQILVAEFDEAVKKGLDRLQIEEILGKKLEKELENEKNIVKTLNVRGAVLKGVVGLMDKLGLSAFTQVLNLEKANEVLDETYRKTGNVELAFKQATKTLFIGLKRALKDPATSFVVYGAIAKKALGSAFNDIKGMVHSALEVNAHATQLARSLGTSSTNAHHMLEETKSVGRAMGDVVFTGKDYSKTISETNEALGLNLNLGGKTNHELTKMNEMMGLTAQESTQIYKLGALNNQELSKTNRTIAAGIVSAQKQYKIQVNAKQVYQAIGKLSAATLANFKQNPEALAKAVVQAKRLGTDLDKMDASARSLLDFESSIEAELEAELLTGKKINLEKAREAALNNDQVGYMNAIAEETGNLAEFNAKNRFQQEALAKAFGMTRGEMAEMLQQQEVYNKLGDVTGKSAAEQLEIARQRGLSESDSLVVSLQQQANSEKLAKTFEGLKETIAGIVEGPLGQMVGSLAKMLNSAGGIGTIVAIMATSTLVKMAVGFASLVKAARTLRALSIGTAIAQGWKAAMSGPLAIITGGIAALGIGAGITAAIMSSSKSENANDLVDPGGSGGGYGKRSLITPKGTYALNNKDTVIAGTNLFRANDLYTGPEGSLSMAALAPGAYSHDNFKKIGESFKQISAKLDRPVTIQANTDDILRLQTVQSQYGAPNSFA